MKKESASRRKKLPLLLGALLIISVAAYGTRAYFSDSAQMQANIVLELGNVKVTADGGSWVSTASGENELVDNGKDDNGNHLFKNVKPGDFFKRTYTIENKGSLKSNIKLKYKGNYMKSQEGVALESLPGQLKSTPHRIPDTPFIVTINGLQTEYTLEPSQQVNYDVIISVDKDAGKSFNNTNGTVDVTELANTFLNETLVIEANQANK